VKSTSELHFASYHTNMNYTVPADDVEIQSRWEEIGTVPFKVQKFI